MEFSQINVQGSIETERSRDGRDNLGNQTIQVGVSWALNVQVATADIVDSLVVNHEGTVRVLKGGVRAENRVVWLNNGSRDLWGGINGEFELGFLAIIDRETLQEQGSETRSSSSSERVEDQESLETSAVISELADTVQDKVDNFLSNGVVTTGIVCTL